MKTSEVNAGMAWHLSFVMSIMLLCKVSYEKPDYQTVPEYRLEYTVLPEARDEAIQLRNGVLGALVWKNGENLRFSLNRADLWDYRETFDAWFMGMTNFVLAMDRQTYTKAAELAELTGYREDAGLWCSLLTEWPEYELDDTGGLAVASNQSG